MRFHEVAKVSGGLNWLDHFIVTRIKSNILWALVTEAFIELTMDKFS